MSGVKKKPLKIEDIHICVLYENLDEYVFKISESFKFLSKWLDDHSNPESVTLYAANDTAPGIKLKVTITNSFISNSGFAF